MLLKLNQKHLTKSYLNRFEKFWVPTAKNWGAPSRFFPSFLQTWGANKSRNAKVVDDNHSEEQVVFAKRRFGYHHLNQKFTNFTIAFLFDDAKKFGSYKGLFLCMISKLLTACTPKKVKRLPLNAFQYLGFFFRYYLLSDGKNP